MHTVITTTNTPPPPLPEGGLKMLPDVIEYIRPLVADAKSPTKRRIRTLWSFAKEARGLAADKVVTDAFTQLAVDANLIDRHGRWTGTDVANHRVRLGHADVAHVISWALRGLNPFETGPLT